MRAAYFSSEVQMTQFQISPNQFHRTYLTLLAQMKMLNSCIVRYHIRIVRKRNNRKPGAACGHAAYLANTLSRRLEKKKPSTSQSKKGMLPCLISVNSSSWANVALLESVRTALYEQMCAREGDMASIIPPYRHSKKWNYRLELLSLCCPGCGSTSWSTCSWECWSEQTPQWSGSTLSGRILSWWTCPSFLG